MESVSSLITGLFRLREAFIVDLLGGKQTSMRADESGCPEGSEAFSPGGGMFDYSKCRSLTTKRTQGTSGKGRGPPEFGCIISAANQSRPVI